MHPVRLVSGKGSWSAAGCMWDRTSCCCISFPFETAKHSNVTEPGIGYIILRLPRINIIGLSWSSLEHTVGINKHMVCPVGALQPCASGAIGQLRHRIRAAQAPLARLDVPCALCTRIP